MTSQQRINRLIIRVAIWATCFAPMVLASCVSLFGNATEYDKRPLSVQTLNFFNQRVQPSTSTTRWSGDWMLRRERLELIDRELRRSHPDVLIAQDVMSRRGSATDDDLAILEAGALPEFEWNEEMVQEYPDTDEIQSLAVGVSPPLKIVPASVAESAPNSPAGTDSAAAAADIWLLGSNGFLMLTVVNFDWQPFVVANVELPSEITSSPHWYTFVMERISDFMSKRQVCPSRLMMAGQLPATGDSVEFTTMMETLGLKDSSIGFCQVASRCHTATPQNETFMVTAASQSGLQADRIYVSIPTIVFQSQRTFDRGVTDSPTAKAFGMGTLYPTQRFGWMTEIKMPRCTEDDKAPQ